MDLMKTEFFIIRSVIALVLILLTTLSFMFMDINPGFDEKNISASSGERYLTEEKEIEWIKNHPTIKIGYT